MTVGEKETCPTCGKHGYSFLHSCAGVPQKPFVAKTTYEVQLDADCIYCGRRCKRERIYEARTREDAMAQADASLAAGIWHRKCGLS